MFILASSCSLTLPNSMSRHWQTTYLVIQAAGGLAWWACLALLPDFRRACMPQALPPETLLAIAFPDTLLFVVGSATCALLLRRSSDQAATALLLLLGAVVYATLHAVSWALLGRTALPGAVAMCIASAFTATIATTTCRRTA